MRRALAGDCQLLRKNSINFWQFFIEQQCLSYLYKKAELTLKTHMTASHTSTADDSALRYSPLDSLRMRATWQQCVIVAKSICLMQNMPISAVFRAVSCESGQNAPTLFICKSQNAPNAATCDVHSARVSCGPCSRLWDLSCLIYRSG